MSLGSLLRFAAPCLSLAGLVLLWDVATRSGAVSPLLLPPPAAVLQSLLDNLGSGKLLPHIAATLQVTAIGYAVGCALAIAVAAVLSESARLDRALYPYIIVLQSIPKVALAPLVFLWVGFDQRGTVLLVSLICFFPVFVTAFSAFRAVDPALMDLYRALSASRSHVFWHLKLPAAASAIFSGLRVAVVFALIGCVVMEFIVGTTGVGYLIESAAATLDLPIVFVAMILLGLIGLAASGVVAAIHAKVVHWERVEFRAGATA